MKAKQIVIDREMCCWRDGKCTCSCGSSSCEGCAEVCPAKAITRKNIVIVDPEKCTLCGTCIDVCPNKAISFSVK